MKKKNRNLLRKDESIEKEIEDMSREMDDLEYELLLRDQDLAHAKSRYWELSIRIERTIMAESERASVEKEMGDLEEHISKMDSTLNDHRQHLSTNRVRLGLVRETYASQHKARRK